MANKDIKQALINSTIHTISSVGIDSATTKQLAQNADVNEVYIYRIFGGKDNLFAETFNYVDKDFSAALLKFLPIAYTQSKTIEGRFRSLFKLVWQYTVDNKEKCSFFIRYYYSRYYTNELSQKRKNVYANVLKIFDSIFVHGTDTWWLFNHVLDVVFSTAVKVLRNEMQDNEATQETIFNLLYPALQQYFKN